MKTGDNARFLRFWWEVNNKKTLYRCRDNAEAVNSGKKWFPYNKGGDFQKWYGNNDYIVNFENDGIEMFSHVKEEKRHVQNLAKELRYKECITWTLLSSSSTAFRYRPYGSLYDMNGMCFFPTKENIKQLLAFSNSKVMFEILKITAPTLAFQLGDVGKTPIMNELLNDIDIGKLSENNISTAKCDWDSFETSWDFQNHPLIYKNSTIGEAFNQWQKKCNDRFKQVKDNEEELNRIFIDIYGLQNELTPEVDDKDITVRKADLSRDIRSFISYAVGCMFGRYSLDEEGLIYAGGEWDDSKYVSFVADRDNIIPICDDEYFEDDIVGLFVEFVKTVYGADSLEENLDFIANALGNKGATSREVIRNYFLKDFYKDHLKTYQKRPIYWMFDSGKQNGFKALIYMHRYDADTVGRVRTDYLHQAQRYVETAMQSAQYTIDNASSASEKSKATKAVTKYTKQLAEMKIYDEAIAHIANQRIEIDLDDGVKVNYAKFQGVEVAQEGKKALKVDLLAKIK